MVKIKFEFPDTGEGVTEGKFLEWKIEEGDEVEEDQVVGEAETDKAVVEIPAPADGTVEDLKASPGDQVSVGDVIMILDTGDRHAEESDSNIKEEVEEKESLEEKDKAEETKGTKEISSSTSGDGDVLALPKVRKLAEEKGVDLASIKTGERVTGEEVLAAAEDEITSQNKDRTQKQKIEQTEKSSQVQATPSVRKLAHEKDVDISSIDGSGRGGKVTREDVLQASKSGEETSEEQPVERDVDTDKGEVERVEMSGVRKTTARKMEKSRFTAPHVTHVERADITELAELREEVKENVDAHLTYLPFIMKACVEALQEYPDLNAELDEEKDEIVRKKYYDFNIAVDTDRGLLVPKIEDVESRDMVELAEDIVEKAEKARNGKLGREEMQGGTFSITNLGVIGGEEFTPIINYPQVAILGVGKIAETAEVVDGELTPRTTVKLSLSYDHRVVDGATAARFMNRVVEMLENPERLMVEL